MKAVFVLIPLLFFSACYQVKSGQLQNAVSSFASVRRQLLTATVKLEDYPWSASVYSVDLDQMDSPHMVLSGESSDPVMFQIDDDRVLLFNRASDNQNYRIFERKDEVWSVSGQFPLSSLSPGDPHDAILLSNNKVLLANYVAGNLAMLDLDRRELDFVEEYHWNLPEGSQFHPESFLRNEDEIWVIHQGYGFSSDGMIANDSQAAFQLRWKNEELNVGDLDLATATIDGVKLHGSFPVPSATANADRYPLWSLCSQYIDNSTRAAGKECRQVVEAFDFSAAQTTELWDLSSLGLFMNGTARSGKTELDLYASVEVAQDSQFDQGRYIAHFNVIDQIVDLDYKYEENSGGFWAFWFDQETEELIAGDSTESFKGKLTVIKYGEVVGDIPLQEVPYTGVLLRGHTRVHECSIDHRCLSPDCF